MKEKKVTIISTLMMMVPWTILILRKNEWALESPAAEISISCYAVFMIASGIFTIFFYQKKKIQNVMMKISLLVNGLYMIGGIAVFGMMATTNWSI